MLTVQTVVVAGSIFSYSTGTIQLICITDAEMVKEMSLHTSLNLGKPSYLSTERGPLLGRGILSSNGAYWAHQRKIIAPEFYLERVKVQNTFEHLPPFLVSHCSCNYRFLYTGYGELDG